MLGKVFDGSIFTQYLAKIPKNHKAKHETKNITFNLFIVEQNTLCLTRWLHLYLFLYMFDKTVSFSKDFYR